MANTRKDNDPQLKKLHAALAQVRDLRRRATTLHKRLTKLGEKGVLFIVGKRLTMEATEPVVPDENERDETIDGEADEMRDGLDDLREAFEELDGQMVDLEEEIPALAEQTTRNDEHYEEVQDIQREFESLRRSVADFRESALYIELDELATEGIPDPTAWGENALEEIQTELATFTLETGVTPEIPAPTVPEGEAPAELEGTEFTLGLNTGETIPLVEETFAPRTEAPATPPPAEEEPAPATPPPAAEVAVPATPPPVRERRGAPIVAPRPVEERSEVVTPPPAVTERAVVPPATTEFPSRPEAIRLAFTYSAERHGTPEQFTEYLAGQLTTPERVNAYLAVMFRYTNERDNGQNQAFVNSGRTERNEHWQTAMSFFTSYDGAGKVYGDCDDIAIAFSHLFRMQGRNGFAVEVGNATRSPTGGIMVNGHMLGGYTDTDPSGRPRVHVIDTTGDGRTQASIRSTIIRPGETPGQAYQRVIRETTTDPTPMNPELVRTSFVTADGRAFGIPANFALLMRSQEMGGHLEARNYAAVLGMIREEIARAPDNLMLRVSEIQFLVLTGASDADLNAAIARIATIPAANTADAASIYDVLATYNQLVTAGKAEMATAFRRAAIRD